MDFYLAQKVGKATPWLLGESKEPEIFLQIRAAEVFLAALFLPSNLTAPYLGRSTKPSYQSAAKVMPTKVVW